MTELFSLEFWVGFQFFVDLLMVGLILGLVKRLKHIQKKAGAIEDGNKPQTYPVQETGDHEARSGAEAIIAMLEPLVRESESAAQTFERQISEKKHLIRSLNKDLDTKIISINLLLNRAERLLYEDPNRPVPPASLKKPDIVQQQASILELFDAGLDHDTIASRLSMPKGEVQLVINLKKKFAAMGNSE